MKKAIKIICIIGLVFFAIYSIGRQVMVNNFGAMVPIQMDKEDLEGFKRAIREEGIYKPKEGEAVFRSTLRFNLLNVGMSDIVFIVASGRVGKGNLYVGPYKPEITFTLSKNDFLDKPEANYKGSAGTDNLSLTFFDVKKNKTYDAGQDMPFHTWAENGVADVEFLPMAKVDPETGRPVRHIVRLRK